jgi:hypothetical protein
MYLFGNKFFDIIISHIALKEKNQYIFNIKIMIWNVPEHLEQIFTILN